MLDTISANDVVFDVGANRGYYTLAILANHPTARVFAFEPNPLIFQKLLRNIELNGWSDRGRAFCFALGDQECKLKLNIAFSDTASSFCPTQAKIGGQKIVRQALSSIKTMDSLLKEYGIPTPQHIKIDTEGYEKQILVGANNILKAHHPKLYLEGHPLEPDDRTVADIRSVLRKYNYQITQMERYLFCF